MRLTEHDAARIAVHAGCAPSTVRRTLTNGNVSAYSRSRVIDACDALGFPVPTHVRAAPVLAKPEKPSRELALGARVGEPAR